MIRRDADGQWLLISQVEHARLAGELAAVWGNEDVAALPMPHALVPAVIRHDVGWQTWEARPTIEAAHGRPRSFTEMPMNEACRIWSRSIDCCASIDPALQLRHWLLVSLAEEGWADDDILRLLAELSSAVAVDDVPPRALERTDPHALIELARTCRVESTAGRAGRALAALCGLWVSRHFCCLAQRALAGRSGESLVTRPLQEFLWQQSPKQRHWREAATVSIAETELEALMNSGLQYLQALDAISLWMCCSPSPEPFETTLPGGQILRLAMCASGRILAEPHPLSVARLTLCVPARRIDARRYADDADLRQALAAAPLEHVRWTFERETLSVP
ncbi:MAG: DUF3891 family protein [Planctomycetes bacterium]|nr:DUF3891 family protein [Planctomycetota bacterium]